LFKIKLLVGFVWSKLIELM